MPNRLPIPPELDSLIEKRDAPDRRQDEPTESSDAASQRTPEEEDRRTGEDRRG